MRKLTLLLIPEGTRETKQVRVPVLLVKTLIVASAGLIAGVSYLISDYLSLKQLKLI